MSKLAYFVTGTDTEIGKTTVSSIIIRALAEKGLQTAAMSPVAAGAIQLEDGLHNEDVDALMKASNVQLPTPLICPYLLRTPVSPNLSAMEDGKNIDLLQITNCYQQISQQVDAVIVEGVGGFLVPFSPSVLSADLAVQLALPVIMVVGMKLGCINHALLTAEAIHARGLKLVGWVANCIDFEMGFKEGNIATLEKWLNAPRLGTIPYLKSFAHAERYLQLDILPNWPK